MFCPVLGVVHGSHERTVHGYFLVLGLNLEFGLVLSLEYRSEHGYLLIVGLGHVFGPEFGLVFRIVDRQWLGLLKKRLFRSLKHSAIRSNLEKEVI